MRRFLAVVRITAQGAGAYAWASLASAGTYAFRVAMLLLLFRAMYAAAGTGSVAGFTMEQVGWAMAFAQAVSTSSPNTIKSISDDVKSGRVAADLLLPMSYPAWKSADSFAQGMMSLAAFLPLGIVLSAVILGGFPADAAGFAAAVALLPGAVLLRSLNKVFVGLSAFFFEDADAFRWINEKLMMIFAGNVVPVPFMPGPMVVLAKFLPYAYCGYYAGLQLGGFDGAALAAGLAMQAAWCLLTWLAIVLLYRRAARKLSVNGS